MLELQGKAVGSAAADFSAPQPRSGVLAVAKYCSEPEYMATCWLSVAMGQEGGASPSDSQETQRRSLQSPP